MRTLILSGFCSLILTASAFSQAETRKPSIAVIPFAESGRAIYGGAELADLLSKELASSSKFDVVDKAKTTAIEPVLLKGPKDAIEAAAAAEIGRTMGAQFLVLGNVTEYSEKVKVTLTGVKSYDAIVKFSLRAVDTATGAVVLEQSFANSGVSMGEAKNITGSFASKAMQDAVSKSMKNAVAALVKKLGAEEGKGKSEKVKK
jgi:curli biogenesis system outer membrane secretion channel CsgG